MRRMYSENQLQEITKEVIKGGQVENAKPLYFHPITIYNSEDDYNCLFTMIIINNSETAFTPTTLKSYLKTVGGRFLLNGAFQKSTYYLSPAMINKSGDTLYVIGWDNNGVYHSENANQINFDSILDKATGARFADEVNKIN